MKIWHVYIIVKNGHYYTGISSDLSNRLRQHGNAPLLYEELFLDKHKAAFREKQIKGFSRAKKEALMAQFSG